MNTLRARIMDVAGLGFVVDLPDPVADHPHGDITTEFDGSFRGALSTELSASQLAALQQVRDMKVALVQETWDGNHWKAGPRFHLEEPLDIPAGPGPDGTCLVVMNFKQTVH